MVQNRFFSFILFLSGLSFGLCGNAQAAVLFLPHANTGYAETCMRLGMSDIKKSGYLCEEQRVIDEMNQSRIRICFKNCKAQSCKMIAKDYKTAVEKSDYELKGYNCSKSSERSIGGDCYRCSCDNGSLKDGYCQCGNGYSRKQKNGVWSCSCEAVDHKELFEGSCMCSSGYYLNDKNECICDGSVNKEVKSDGSCGCLSGTVEQADGRCKKVNCFPGYYLEGSVCKACPSGSYSEEGAIGIESCRYCPEGYTLGLGNCNSEEHPEGFEYSNALDENNMPVYLGHSICGKCEAKSCTEPYGKVSSCNDDTKALFYNGEYTGNTACGACIQIKCAEGKVDYEACFENGSTNYGSISAWVLQGSLVK